jgi:hypothetical protein
LLLQDVPSAGPYEFDMKMQEDKFVENAAGLWASLAQSSLLLCLVDGLIGLKGLSGEAEKGMKACHRRTATDGL